MVLALLPELRSANGRINNCGGGIGRHRACLLAVVSNTRYAVRCKSLPAVFRKMR